MHILVIEDDKNLNQGICFAIQKEGYQVSCAHSLGETAKILKKEDIGLLILDLNLPDGDGIEFCQEFRRTSKVPVIMLTARDMENKFRNLFAIAAIILTSVLFSVTFTLTAGIIRVTEEQVMR